MEASDTDAFAVAARVIGETFTIEARHPLWSSAVVVAPRIARVCRGLDGLGGTYALRGLDLAIRWDSGARDTFRLVDGVYVHADLAAATPNADLPRPSRAIIVTAYFKEDRRILERCLRSVETQTVATDHIVVADGHPQAWIDAMPVRHIRLDKAHGDYGNTPRGVGALLAISEGYDGIGFLDADNWLEPDHVESCLAAARAAPAADYVVAQRFLRRPDASVIPFSEDRLPDHVDTNCFFLLEGSYHMAHHFSTMPREFALVGDKVFYLALKAAGLTSARVPRKTVNYSCLWPTIYRLAGEEPPPEAKADIDVSHLEPWLARQTPRALDIIGRRAGVRFSPAPTTE